MHVQMKMALVKSSVPELSEGQSGWSGWECRSTSKHGGEVRGNVRAWLQLMYVTTQYTYPGFKTEELNGEAEGWPPKGGRTWSTESESRGMAKSQVGPEKSRSRSRRSQTRSSCDLVDIRTEESTAE